MTNAAPQKLNNFAASPEKPLPPWQNALYLLLACFLVIGLCLYCTLILLAVLALAVAPLAVSAIKSEPLIFILCLPGLYLLGRITITFARGCFERQRDDHWIPLTREEAPKLWLVVEELGRDIQVEVPHAILLEHGANAGMWFSGRSGRKGQRKLVLGFDLLAGLSATHVRTVLAHELAHAKYVHHGFSRFISFGLRIANRVGRALQYLKERDDVFSISSALAGFIEGHLRKICGGISRLLARCRRYDEFVADRVAAEICGSQNSREALLGIYVVQCQLPKIAWRDRIVHLRHQEGYTAWLGNKLQVESEAEQHEMRTRAMEWEERDEFSTHPILSDRIGAIDALAATGKPWTGEGLKSGAEWLLDPDQSARKLLEEIERIAADEERLATRALERNSRYLFKRIHLDPIRLCQLIIVWMVAFIAFVIVLVVLEGIGISTKSVQTTYFLAYLIMVPCLFLYWVSRQSQVGVEIPVPSLADYRRVALEESERERNIAQKMHVHGDTSPSIKRERALQRAQDAEETQVEIGRRLRPLLPGELTDPKAIARFWAEKGAAFLATCDYESARHCARLAFEAKNQHLASLLIYSVGDAFHRNVEQGDIANFVWSKSRDANVRWALAWSKCLLRNSEGAEPQLLRLTRERPQKAIFWALLGQCQDDNGKPREALDSRRRALEAHREQGESRDEACLRYDLAKSLVALGLVQEALPEFQWLLERRQEGPLDGIHDFNLGFGWLNWNLASRDIGFISALAEKLAHEHNEPRFLISLANALADDPSEELKSIAASLNLRVLDVGFYPTVMLSQAKRNFDAGNKIEARRLVLESLDAGRERPFDSTSSMYVLKGALELLMMIDDPTPCEVQAFEAHLDASDTPLKLKDLWLLCYFQDESQALSAATEIFEALLPEYELEEWIDIRALELDSKPTRLVSPGVYQFRYEAE